MRARGRRGDGGTDAAAGRSYSPPPFPRRFRSKMQVRRFVLGEEDPGPAFQGAWDGAPEGGPGVIGVDYEEADDVDYQDEETVRIVDLASDESAFEAIRAAEAGRGAGPPGAAGYSPPPGSPPRPPAPASAPAYGGPPHASISGGQAGLPASVVQNPRHLQNLVVALPNGRSYGMVAAVDAAGGAASCKINLGKVEKESIFKKSGRGKLRFVAFKGGDGKPLQEAYPAHQLTLVCPGRGNAVRLVQERGGYPLGARGGEEGKLVGFVEESTEVVFKLDQDAPDVCRVLPARNLAYLSRPRG